MSSVDNRIVKMIFDNDKFEAGVSQTLSTLDKLKDKLTFKGADKSFKDVESSLNGMNFGNVEAGVEALQKRFSTLGIVGMEVTKRITNAAIDAGKRLVDATVGQAKSGGMSRSLNIEQARFQLRGLFDDLKDADAKVEEVMAAASDAVEGTAYGLDEAAKAASVLAASGITDGTRLTGVLKSVAGAAAMSGRSFSDISDIYSTVASNGKLMTMQLRQFASSGLNVSAVLAKEYNKSEDEINELVRKGKISFDDFSEAMMRFSETAGRANDTYMGAMSNMKSALNRIGQLFTDPYVDNMKYIFNAARLGLNEVKRALEPFASAVGDAMGKFKDFVVNGLGALTGELTEEGYKFGAIKDLVDGLVNILGLLIDIVKPVGSAFRDMFPNATIGNLINVLAKFKEFTGALQLNEKQAKNVEYLYKAIFSIFKLIGTVIGTVVRGIGRIFEPFGGLLNVITSIVGIIGRLVYGFVTLVTKVHIVCRIFTLATTIISGLFSGIVWLVRAVSNVVSLVAHSKPVVAVGNAIADAFRLCVKYVTLCIGKFKEFAGKVAGAIGSKASKVMSSFLGIISKGCKEASKVLSSVVGKIKELIRAFRNSKVFDAFSTSVSKGFKTASKYITVFVGKIKDLAKKAKSFIGSSASSVFSKFVSLVSKGMQVGSKAIGSIVTKAKSLFDTIRSSKTFVSFSNGIANAFKNCVKYISLFIDKIKDLAKKIASYIGSNASSIVSKFVSVAISYFKGWVSVIGTLIGKIKELFVAFKNSSFFNAFVNAISNVVHYLGLFIDKVKEVVLAIVDWVKSHDLVQAFFNAMLLGLQAVAGVIVVVVSKVKEFATTFYNFLKETGLLDKFVNMLKTGFEQAVDGIKIFADWVSKKIIAPLKTAGDKASSFKGKLKDAFQGKVVNKSINTFSEAVSKASSFGDKLKAVFGFLKTFVGNAIKAISGYFDKFKNISGGALDHVKAILEKINLEKIAKYFPYEAMGVFLIAASKFVSNFTVSIYRIADSFSKFGETLTGTMKSVGGGITNTFNALAERLKPSKWQGRVATIVALAAGVYLLARAIKMLSDLDLKQLAQGGIAVAGCLILLTASMVIMEAASNKFKDANMAQIGVGLIGMAAAILLLQKAVAKFGTMNTDVLKKGAISVAAAMVALTLAARFTKGSDFHKTAVGMIAMVAALNMLSNTITLFAAIENNAFIKGLFFIGIALTALVIAIQGMDVNGVLKAAAGLLILNMALVVFAGVMKLYSMLDKNTFLKGLGYITIVLITFAISVNALNNCDIKGVARGLFAMVTSLVAVAGVIWLLGKADFRSTIGAASVLVASLITMSLSLYGLSKNTENFGKTAAALIALAGGLAIIAMSIRLLSGVEFGNIIAAGGVFVGVLITMALVLYGLSKNADNFFKTAATLVIMAAGLMVVAAAIRTLAELPSEGIMDSAMALIGVLAVMAISLYALQNVNAGNLIATAGAIVIMSVAVGVLTLALIGLSGISMEGIMTALIGLGGALLVVTLAGVASEAAVVGLLALSVALLAIGATALMVSTAIQTTTEALTTLAELGPEAMTRVVDAIVTFCEELAAASPRILAAAIIIGSSFIAGLVALIPQIALAGVQMIIGLMSGIAQNIGTIVQLAVSIIVAFILGIASMIGPIVNAGILLMIGFIRGLADGIRNNSKMFFDALADLLEAVLEMVLSAFQTIAEKIPVIGDKISKGLEKAKSEVKGAFKVDEHDIEYGKALDKAKDDIKSKTPDLKNAAKDAAGGVKDEIFGSIGDFELFGEEGMGAWSGGMLNGKDQLIDTSSMLSEEQMKAMGMDNDAIARFKQLGLDQTNANADGILSGKGHAIAKAEEVNKGTNKAFAKDDGTAKKAGKKKTEEYAAGISPKTVLKNIKDIMSSAVKAFSDKAAAGQIKTAGTKSADQYAKGIDSGKSKATTAGKSMANNANAGAKSVDFTPAGLACCSGFLAGLNNQSYANQITARGTALGNMAYNAAKKAIESHSPSKKFMRLGIYANQGFIIGLSSMQDKVYNAGYEIGTNASDGLTESISRVYDLLNSDMDFNPTITPVLDLSNVQNGISSMNSMLDTSTMSASISGNMRGVGLVPAYAMAGAGDQTITNNTNTFNITVDGTESPEAFADRLVEQINLRQRMS